jgi:hypothetical protein
MQGFCACADACGGAVDALEVIGKREKIPRVYENDSPVFSIRNIRLVVILAKIRVARIESEWSCTRNWRTWKQASD